MENLRGHCVGLNSESWGYIESIYPRGILGLLSKTQDEVWDFLRIVAWDTYLFEQAKNNFGYPSPNESIFLANLYPHDHFMNSYGPSYSCVSPVSYDYCESFDHVACNCPYHAYVDATCASFEKKINEMTHQMIEAMKARIAACSQCFN